MNTLIDVAVEVQTFLNEQGWKFCIIGGLAVQNWGEPRLTRDVDITLLTGFGSEEPFIDALLDRFQSRIPNAKSFALENRVLLLHSGGGIGVDISLAGLPFEEEIMKRAVNVEMLQGKMVKICSPEDLVVLKAFAARDTDWRDIRTVIARQGDSNLDWGYIENRLRPLCDLKEEPEILDRLKGLRNEMP